MEVVIFSLLKLVPRALLLIIPDLVQTMTIYLGNYYL